MKFYCSHQIYLYRLPLTPDIILDAGNVGYASSFEFVSTLPVNKMTSEHLSIVITTPPLHRLLIGVC